MIDMDFLKILKLSNEGFQCAQILMIMALEAEGKENEDLIRAAGGLNVGLSDMSGPCGALTGGCCFISYFAGKGAADELEDPAFNEMLAEFTAWFKEAYGGNVCTDILGGDMSNMPLRCPDIVQSSYDKVMEILTGNEVI